MQYYIATTLDGFIVGPDGADPTGPDGFWPISADYIEHLVANYPRPSPTGADGAVGHRRGHPLRHRPGRAPQLRDRAEGRDHRRLPAPAAPGLLPDPRQSPDPAVELVATDPAEKVRELKRQDGKDIWLIGGGELAGALYGEIDRLILKVGSLTTGTGIPLFSHTAAFDPRTWELTDHTVLGSGAAFLTYDRPAEARKGMGQVRE